MQISTRHIDGTLVVDLSGPLPRPGHDLTTARNAFRDALSGNRTDFIVSFREIAFLNSTDIGVFISMLHTAGVTMGGLGSGPFVHIVTANDRVASAFQVVDAPIRVFKTEEEDLSSLRGRGHGCLGAIVPTVVLIASVIALSNAA